MSRRARQRAGARPWADDSQQRQQRGDEVLALIEAEARQRGEPEPLGHQQQPREQQHGQPASR